MHLPSTFHRKVLGAFGMACVASAWWGCAEASNQASQSGSGGAGGSSSSDSSSSSAGGTGGGDIAGSGGSGGGVCVSTSAKASPVPVDLVFLIDRSTSMWGAKWAGIKSALTDFFTDPLSEGISAGLEYFPTVKPFGVECDVEFYKVLDVPIATLPGNAFALTNSMPENPLGPHTPTYAALDGALRAATAYQDAHPTHKVSVVLATDGDPTGCPDVTIGGIAALAKSALSYNGVRTYAIGVQGSTIANLDKVADAGGTVAAYDVTQDINQFAATISEIRKAVLACEFGLPPPPPGMELVTDKVNFTYTAGGADTPVTLPHADDIGDCGDQPGWYYDDNASPTKIVVCPASCVTIQNDSLAEVAVAFGCATVLN